MILESLYVKFGLEKTGTFFKNSENIVSLGFALKFIYMFYKHFFIILFKNIFHKDM